MTRSANRTTGRCPTAPYLHSLHRIDSTFAELSEVPGGLTPDRLHGARVLEIGPGETLGVAIRFIGAEQSQVTANDKFVPLQRGEFHQRLYGRFWTNSHQPSRSTPRTPCC